MVVIVVCTYVVCISKKKACFSKEIFNFRIGNLLLHPLHVEDKITVTYFCVLINEFSDRFGYLLHQNVVIGKGDVINASISFLSF